MHHRVYQRIALLLTLVFAVVLVAACSSSPPISTPGAGPPAAGTATAPTAASPTGTTTAPGADIRIDARESGMPIDPRLRGTNVPAWLNADDNRRFDDATFQARTRAAGVTVLRMPGGSWSNYYDWLACETDNAQQASADGCYWPWAARPTDFLNLMWATGLPAMWTVSMNGTAYEAAALVAFFNGDVDDTRPIGVDVRGRDWRTVGYWARLRSDAGNPEPRKILLWEIGNEIYGGKQGKDCAAFGWEDGWTCDGAEYVSGVGSGNTRREGFLEFRNAMRTVDPSILVGAVGIAGQDGWSNWGNEVIAGAGAELDFYSIHHYAYSATTDNYAEILAQPQSTWAGISADVNAAFDRHADGRRVPVAVTEYNIFAFLDLDTGQLMSRAVNALYMADTLGQLAQHGFTMANQYNLANGVDQKTGADVYGLLNGDTLARNPQYYAFPLWARFGTQMLPVVTRFDPATTLSVYAGRDDSGTITLMAINKTGRPINASIHVEGVASFSGGSADVVAASSLDATAVTFNGQSNPADDLRDAPSTPLSVSTNLISYTFAPYSVTLLRLQASAAS